MSTSPPIVRMVTPIELGLLVLVLALVFGAYRLIKAVRPLVVNAVVGLVVLWLAGALGFGVQITAIVVLLVAFGGLPAAILVILLAQFDVIFEPAMVIGAMLG